MFPEETSWLGSRGGTSGLVAGQLMCLDQGKLLAFHQRCLFPRYFNRLLEADIWGIHRILSLKLVNLSEGRTFSLNLSGFV